jgi:iron complex outermembrane receptor protein
LTVKNERHFFLRSVLTTALVTGTTSVQARAELTGTTSVQTLVLLAGMAAAQTADEKGDVDIDSLGLSLAELFDLEVTIATGVKQSVARAPSVTSVITAQDIESMGVTDLDEALRSIPGLHVSYNGYHNPIYAIRGIYSSFNYEILLLINGIPLKEPFMGDRSLWVGMPVNAIERIEIIRGPGSAVYGADAFSGVINIITKTKEDIDGTEVGTRLGSFNTKEAWALHGVEWGGFDVAVAVEYLDTDGRSKVTASDPQTQFDQRDGTNASIVPIEVTRPRRNIDTRLDISKNNWQIRLGYQGRRNVGNPGGGYNTVDPYTRWNDDRFNADLTYHNSKITDDWDVTAQLSYLSLNTGYPNQIIYVPGNKDFPTGMFLHNAAWASRQTRAEVSGFYTGLNNHMLRLGVGYHYTDLYKIENVIGFTRNEFIDFSDTESNFAREMDRSNWNMFIQDGWSFLPDWEFTAGVRYDEYSDFGKTTNPRLALVWQTFPNFTTKLLYGQAFRAPTFNQTNTSESNQYALGNPNLKPETIETWEIAFDYHATDALRFGLNLFTYNIKDKVIFASEGGESELIRAQNIGEQNGKGFEFETRWKITKKSSLLFNYAFQDSTNKTNNTKIIGTPQRQAYLRSDWLFVPNWLLNTQINWVGERKRGLNDPRKDMDAYTIVDLTIRRKKIQAPWNFAMSVRNLFDEDYREYTDGPDSAGIIKIPNDLPMAGRSYWVELRSL